MDSHNVKTDSFVTRFVRRFNRLIEKGPDAASTPPLKRRPLIVIGTVLAAFFVLWVAEPLVVVPAGNRGVKTTFGKVQQEVLGEGLYFRIPIAQQIHLMNVQLQKGEGAGHAASRDLQHVEVNAAINYRLDSARVAEIYQGIGTAHEVGDRIILPAVHEAVKATVAAFTAEELVTRRADVRERIRAQLETRLAPRGVVVEDFAVTGFRFSKEFEAAIEEKSKAEQMKLKAERDLARIRVEAEQTVAKAKAEAEALTLQRKAEAESLAAQRAQLTRELIQWEAVRRWDGKLPTYVAGGATSVQIPLPGVGGNAK
ncbi:MAG: prohibitin family protein [Casimicrobium sp.]